MCLQKKSREESEGKESGVEILINEPYTDGPGGSGQYTRKIYHIGSHLPGWFQAILPKSALLVEEEAWNAYPYTRTIFRCPFIQKFMLEIETWYYNDGGDQENVFNLSAAEKRSRVVDRLDIVKDTISTGDYKSEEDPQLFKSKKTGRGPLVEDWLETYAKAARSSNSDTAIMCAYKLCKVEFRYWGMQSKIERFIHDVGLRKTMLRAHRQAWCWQDEYHGLTMADIRRLERETQLALQEKMNEYTDRETVSVPDETTTATEPTENNTSNTTSVTISDVTASTVFTESHLPVSHDSPVVRQACSRLSGFDSSHRKESWASVRSGFSRPGSNLALSDWQQMDSLEQLRTPSSDDDEEFFDAHDELHTDLVNQTALLKSSSMEMLTTEETDSVDFATGETTTPLDRRMKQYYQSLSHGGEMPAPSMPLPQGDAHNCHTTVLFLVLHGGSIMDSGYDQLPKNSDIATLKSTFDTVIQAHYPAISGHIAVRLVPCPAICSSTLDLLNSISPAGYSEVSDTGSADGPAASVKPNFLLNTIPLFATGSPTYADVVKQVITRANDVFCEFTHSEEGVGFTGQVCLIGDSIGSIIGYDALCKHFLTTHSCEKASTSDSESSPTDLTCNTSSSSVTWRTNLETIKQMSFSNPDMSGAVVDGDNAANKVNVATTEAKDSGKGHDNCSSWKRQTSCPNSRRTSAASQTGQNRFSFDVSDFFMFGAPLGLILAYRKMCVYDCTSFPLPKPHCLQMYNLFYASDPAGVRLEPLLCGNFQHLSPMNVPRYQKFPLGDGHAVHVVETIQANLSRFIDLPPPSPSLSSDEPNLERRQSNMSMLSQVSGRIDFAVASITAVTSQWWGNKRLDYVLYCPDALQSFPHTALPYLLHASFWESTDAVAFILRQVVRQEYVTMPAESQKEASLFSPSQPREKWLKRRTTMKLRNVAPNHRANDIVVLEGRPQTLVARFMYGPLDIVSLSGEKVDVHIMTAPPQGEWQFFGTVVTESNGKATFEIPKDKLLTLGMYPVKMVVRGDHTSVDFYLAVLQPRAEVVVFSIDGSFTASVSIMGKDPKVRPGAVDVVRYWQDLGYLIIYVTARPDMQQKKVVTWLAQHNFPHGLVSFIDGLSADPLRQKANYLKQLKNEAQIEIHTAYGSSKDISVYQSVGLRPTQIYIVGKVSKKHHKDAVVICDGYAVHLTSLATDSASRPATGNTRMFLRKSCFSLPGQNQGCSRKKQVKKTTSLPPAGVARTELYSKRQEVGVVSIGIAEDGNTVVETAGSRKGSGKKRWSGRNTSPRVPLE
ncbi:hypothetical protein NP493_423g01019 [Ridgeia piscesae]|uniref:DDHD domain-containing protein n=1 Tax=Ridgeia piscesae TaxID=27915 RepID=A0AAD9NU73_RIDPI|nr:hypothetical protein NP493_423g01019 [Ridgeia piscesae]